MPQLFGLVTPGSIVTEVDKKVDVFAFAITLWELVSRKAPWRDEINAQGEKPDSGAFLKALVVSGTRPDIAAELRSKHAPLVDLITRCWAEEYLRRPAFSVITGELTKLGERIGTAD